MTEIYVVLKRIKGEFNPVACFLCWDNMVEYIKNAMRESNGQLGRYDFDWRCIPFDD